MQRRHGVSLAWLTGFCLVVASGLATAEDPDDSLGGFESEGEFDVDVDFDTSTTEQVDRWWNLDGSVAVSSSINWNDHNSVTGTDYSGLQRLRARLEQVRVPAQAVPPAQVGRAAQQRGRRRVGGHLSHACVHACTRHACIACMHDACTACMH